jgi:Tfp pilus assembly protein PilN
MISVNLLPPEMQAEISDSKKNRIALSSLYQMLLLLFVFIVIFIGFYLYFQSILNSKKSSYEQDIKTTEKYGALEESAKKIAEKIDTIKKINAENGTWNGLIGEINTIVPTGVTLNSIKIDTSTKTRGQITGYAASKTNVAAFRDAMEKSKKFQYVDIENSTTQEDPTTKREVENFTITFSLEKGALNE